MKQQQSTRKIAGVDVGKFRLDAAVYGSDDLIEVANDEAGLTTLIAWFEARGVVRVGMEASGGYERALRAALEEAAFEVVVHLPIEVRLFARLKRRRAKNDKLDARLIAAATAQTEAVKAAQDPLLVELAERLTAYEQITDQLASLRGFMEHVTLEGLIKTLESQIRCLERLKAKLAGQVLSRIKSRPDLARRLKLLTSLPGIGPIVAASLVVRMPELGTLDRGQAASLLGVAPFDRDSGKFNGARFITGGRPRPRRMLYLAALSAKRCDNGFKAFAQRLLDRGKAAKVVAVAIMRKLIEAANLVLARGQPWVKHPAT